MDDTSARQATATDREWQNNSEMAIAPEIVEDLIGELEQRLQKARRLVAIVTAGDRYYFPDQPTTSVTGPAWIYDDGEIVQERQVAEEVVYASTNYRSCRVVHHGRNWPDDYPRTEHCPDASVSQL